MGEMCGLKTKHTLEGSKSNKFECLKLHELINDGYSLFSDTPFYSPEFLMGVIETIQNPFDIKLIYSHRTEESWVKSLDNLFKIFKVPDVNGKDRKFLHDNLCYNYIQRNDGYSNHYKMIKEISNVYKIPLLDYQFSDGWKPFCEFVNKEIPNCDIPHLNQTKHLLYARRRLYFKNRH
jgi:hypothetical protein